MRIWGSQDLRTWALLRSFRAASRRAPAALRAQQDRLLRAAVAHAYASVPFYRTYWDDAGFDPRGFRGLDDLDAIPVTTREMATRADEAMVAQGAEAELSHVLTTGGTSGRPLNIRMRPLEQRIRRASGLRIWFEHGFRWTDTTVELRESQHRPHPLERFGIAPKIDLAADQAMLPQLDQLSANGGQVWSGTPTWLRHAAALLQSEGRRPPRPRVVFAAGEVVDRETVTAVTAAFGVPPTGIYGQTEVGFIAWQCERGEGFHVSADNYLVEVRRDGRAAAPGELGRLVITDLRARTMPFLRYDTMDLAVAAAGLCPCGRALPLVQSIEGRETGCLVRPDGGAVTTLRVLDALAGVLPLGRYRVQQTAPDRVVLEVALGTTAAASEAARAILAGLMGPMTIDVVSAPPWEQPFQRKTHTVASALPLPGLQAAA